LIGGNAGSYLGLGGGTVPSQNQLASFDQPGAKGSTAESEGLYWTPQTGPRLDRRVIGCSTYMTVRPRYAQT
jgi:hypothetical protein